MIPIAILSMGRSDNLTTMSVLREPLSDKMFYIFVEPFEYDKYKKFEDSNTIVIPFDKRSGSYGHAVNNVFKYMKERYTYFWLIDDDVEYFYERDRYDTEKDYWHLDSISGEDIANAFKEVEDKLVSNDYSQASFSYRQTNIYNGSDWKKNRACTVIVLMNTKYVDGHQSWCTVWGDIELSLRMVYNGHPNIICYKYAFGYPGMSKNDGGLANYYASEEAISETKKIVDKIIQLYGSDIVRPTSKKAHGNRLYELSISWNRAEKKSKTGTLF